MPACQACLSCSAPLTRPAPLPTVPPTDHKVLVIAEADYSAVPLAQRDDLQQQQQPAAMDTDGAPQQQDGIAGPEADEATAAREEQWGAPKGEPGQWASCVR